MVCTETVLRNMPEIMDRSTQSVSLAKRMNSVTPMMDPSVNPVKIHVRKAFSSAKTAQPKLPFLAFPAREHRIAEKMNFSSALVKPIYTTAQLVKTANRAMEIPMKQKPVGIPMTENVILADLIATKGCT
jgi:hypothetical protein